MSKFLSWYTPPQEPLVSVLCPPSHRDYDHTYTRIECKPPLLPDHPDAVFKFWVVIPSSLLPMVGRCTGKRATQLSCEKILSPHFRIVLEGESPQPLIPKLP